LQHVLQVPQENNYTLSVGFVFAASASNYDRTMGLELASPSQRLYLDATSGLWKASFGDPAWAMPQRTCPAEDIAAKGNHGKLRTAEPILASVGRRAHLASN